MPTKSTPTRSTPTRSTSHEIKSHEINSHEVNSHQINFPRDQLPRGQLPPDQLPIKIVNEVWQEGWHSRLKKIVRKSHPKIFEIVDVLRKEQATTEMKFEARHYAAIPKKEICAERCKINHTVSKWEVQLSRVFGCCSTSNWILETIISYWWNCKCILTY